MSDADYRRVVALGGKRVKGSMGMLNPQQFDFHAFAPTPEPPVDTPRQVLRTEHAKTTVKPDHVRFVVVVRRKEPEPDISGIIYDEADAATEFIMANV